MHVCGLKIKDYSVTGFPDTKKREYSLINSFHLFGIQLVIDDVTLNNSGEKFLQNKEMYPPYKPFRIVLTKEGTISHVVFKEGDPIWSMNFKRAIASTLQFQMKSSGAFVVDEVSDPRLNTAVTK